MSMGNPSAGEIFVVDDDALVRGALDAVLSREGYHVTGFAEGAARDRGNVPAHVKLLSKPFRRAELSICIRDTLDGVAK